MAEIKVTELPVMSLSDFTANDHFLMVDDEKARLLSKAIFTEWLSANVKGDKGEQGVAGKDGANGTNGINGTNGKDGESAYEIAVDEGFTGTQSEWIKSITGVKGDTGATGANGWTPTLKLVTYNSGVYIQVSGWTGGSGTAPSTGYLSTTGIVSNIANATNIKGDKGDTGLIGNTGKTGDTGSTGATGADGASAYTVAVNNGYTGTESEWLNTLIGTPVKTVSVSDSGVVKITDSAGNIVSSNTPNITVDKSGFYVTTDGTYTEDSPLTLTAGTDTTLTNSGSVVVDKTKNTLFTSPDSFTVVDGGYYKLTLTFTCTASTSGVFTLKNDSETLYTKQIEITSGDNKIQFDYYTTGSGGSDYRLTVNSSDAESIYNIKQEIVRIV